MGLMHSVHLNGNKEILLLSLVLPSKLITPSLFIVFLIIIYGEAEHSFNHKSAGKQQDDGQEEQASGSMLGSGGGGQVGGASGARWSEDQPARVLHLLQRDLDLAGPGRRQLIPDPLHLLEHAQEVVSEDVRQLALGPVPAQQLLDQGGVLGHVLQAQREVHGSIEVPADSDGLGSGHLLDVVEMVGHVGDVRLVAAGHEVAVKVHHDQPTLLLQIQQQSVRHVASVAAHGEGRRVAKNNRRLGVLQRGRGGVPGSVGKVHDHPHPVHLLHHSLPKGRQAVVLSSIDIVKF